MWYKIVTKHIAFLARYTRLTPAEIRFAKQILPDKMYLICVKLSLAKSRHLKFVISTLKCQT
jgi:hypothetical protein